MTASFHIVRIQNDDQKSLFTRGVLEKLPEWFGNKKAIDEYVERVREYPYWAALDSEGKGIGFFSVKTHYQYTGEIYVCGVLKEYQHKGGGKALYYNVENYFMQKRCQYVIVKTLSDTVEFEPYQRTRKFYKSVGFNPLITLTEMWDEENPCLIMLKLLEQ